MNYIGRTLSLHFLTGTELHRNGEVHGGSMKNSKFKIFKIQISKYSKFKVYSPTAFRLGVPISFPRLSVSAWDGFGRVHGGSMNYIGRTSSLHFLTGTELHRNGEVHGGSMNHIGTTSSLHFLIRSKLHRNGEVHRGSMNHFFIFVFILLLFPNSL